MMKRTLAIFFLSVYLLATTEAGELFKLPVIFQHYQEHQLLTQELTFLQFLDIHYMHGSPRDADYDRDMQLPFKTCDHSTIVTANCVMPSPVFIMERKVHLSAKQPILPYTNPDYSYHFLASIWQPPRTC